MFARLRDLITDRRFPWVPASLPKRSQSAKSKRILVVLTFDVEQDGGSKGLGKTEKASPFFEAVRTGLGKRPATFFVQGSLVEKFKAELKRLPENIELGVHAWSHDRIWGDPVWFLPEKPLSRAEKAVHLQKALAAFAKAGLPKPRTFRATNLVVNRETLQILPQYGFTVDSSWGSFRDFRRPFQVNGLWEIPVSNLPLPRKRLGIVKDYQVMNMANLKRLPIKIWQENVRQMVAYQPMPYLVFMAHSWDFKRQKFLEFIATLERDYQVTYVTMQGLKKRVKD